MVTTHSFSLLTSALVISIFGIFSQQPVIAGASAGIFSSVGSAHLVRARRKEEERVTSARNNALQAGRIQALEREIANLNTQAAVVNNLVDTITDTQVSVRQLEYTVKTQGSKLTIQTKGIQKLQKINYSHRSTIAAQAKELSYKDREITFFKNELDLVRDREVATSLTPPRNPITYLSIDGNAMRFIEKEIGKIDYQALKQLLTQGAETVECNFYLAETGKAAQKQFIAKLREIGFNIFLFPIVSQIGGIQKTKGDDVQIAIDAVSALPGDRVILCGGGDSDFFPVVDRLKAKGIDFTVVAHKPILGDRLKRSAGENLVYLTAIDGIKLSE